MSEELKFVDATNGNVVRVVEHEGFVYFETTAKHAGSVVVLTSVRVNRDQAWPALRRMVLR